MRHCLHPPLNSIRNLGVGRDHHDVCLVIEPPHHIHHARLGQKSEEPGSLPHCISQPSSAASCGSGGGRITSTASLILSTPTAFLSFSVSLATSVHLLSHHLLRMHHFDVWPLLCRGVPASRWRHALSAWHEGARRILW